MTLITTSSTKTILNAADKLYNSLQPLFNENERELIKIIKDNNGVAISRLTPKQMQTAVILISRKSIYEYTGGFSGTKYYGIRQYVSSNTGNTLM